MKNIRLYFILIFLFPLYSFSQSQSEIDSLEERLTSSKILNQQRIDLLNSLAIKYLSIKPTKTIEYGHNALELSKKIDYKKGIADSYSSIENGYYFQGDEAKTLEFILKSIKAYETIKDDENTARHYYYLGSFYRRQKEDSLTLVYYEEAQKIYEKLEDQQGISGVLNSTGRVYYNKGEYKKALSYFENALKIRENLNNSSNIAYSLRDIGSVYLKQKSFKKAENYFRKSLKLYKSTNNNKRISEANLALSQSLFLQKKYEEAEKLLMESYDIANKAGFKSSLIKVCALLIDLSVEKNNYQKAFEYQVEMNKLDKILDDENAQTKIASLQSGFELNKKQAQIDLLNKDKELKQKEAKQQLTFIVALLTGLAMVTGLVFVQKKQNAQRRKANSKLREQNEEINSKNTELETLAETLAGQRNKIEQTLKEIEHQKSIVTKKNNDIRASMTYAGRIQATLLPQASDFEKLLPQSFALFQPKDIVSGDFYWLSEKDGRTYVIAIDCTGHGVPGAIMSILAHDMLNIVLNIKGVTSPELILKALHSEVRNILRQYDTNNREGMDVSICVIDKMKNVMEFAGAKNPLVYIKNEVLHEIKGDRMSIGGQLKLDERDFTKHTLALDTPITFYLFSDGYQDQFGGPESKKFMLKQLKSKLNSIHNLSFTTQHDILKSLLNEWKGDKEKQTDDVLVIGARV